MYIFVEDFPYPNAYFQLSYFHSDIKIDIKDSYFYIRSVGYCKNSSNEFFLFLPKTFEKNGCLFEDIPVTEFLYKNAFSVLEQNGKTEQDFHLLNQLSILLYKTLEMTINRKTDNKILPEIVSNIGKEEHSLLSIIYSLIDIHKKHSHLYFKRKYQSKRPSSKVNWNRTFKKGNSFYSEGDILYPNMITTRNEHYQDELLLQLFYTLLFQFKKEYRFKITLQDGLPILIDKEFKKNEHTYLKSLKKMRNKKFDDISKQIVNLLILYFESLSLARNGKAKEEIFITNSFNLVFEKMIDDLLSDPEDLKKFKAQRDGKTLDHIFHSKSPFSDNNTLFVGDSKYYKNFEDVKGHSLFKQYTYARNLIQQYVDDYSSKRFSYYKREDINLQNPLLLSYEVIPNFFIFPDFNPKEPFSFLKEYQNESFHYPNQLYDRDTHVLLYFKIDLYFLMNEYIKNHHSSHFLLNFIITKVNEYYWEKFKVYELKHDHLEETVKQHFYQFHGKAFSLPFVVLEKKYEKENQEFLSFLDALTIEYSEVENE